MDQCRLRRKDYYMKNRERLIQNMKLYNERRKEKEKKENGGFVVKRPKSSCTRRSKQIQDLVNNADD